MYTKHKDIITPSNNDMYTTYIHKSTHPNDIPTPSPNYNPKDKPNEDPMKDPSPNPSPVMPLPHETTPHTPRTM